MAIPYPVKRSQLEQHRFLFARTLFRRLLHQHLETIVLIRHEAKCGDWAQAVSS